MRSGSIIAALAGAVALAVGGYFLGARVHRAPAATGAPAPLSQHDLEAALADGFTQMNKAAADPAAARAASRRFEEVLATDPKNARALFGIGWASHVSKDPVTAEARYREASLLAERGGADLADIRFFCRFNLGVLYREQGHLAVAAAEFQEAAQIGEQIPAKLGDRVADAWLNLGKMLTRLERYTEALPALEQALKRSPQNGAIHLEKGLALWSSGRKDFARIELDEAVRLAPALKAEAERIQSTP